MPLLSKNAIKQLLKSGELVGKPLPEDDHFARDAVDVHLGDDLYAWEKWQLGGTMTVPLEGS